MKEFVYDKNKTNFLIYGTTGQHDDKDTWYLGYTYDLENASKIIKILNQQAKEFIKEIKKINRFSQEFNDYQIPANFLDRNIKHHYDHLYDEIEYNFENIPLLETKKE